MFLILYETSRRDTSLTYLLKNNGSRSKSHISTYSLQFAYPSSSSPDNIVKFLDCYSEALNHRFAELQSEFITVSSTKVCGSRLAILTKGPGSRNVCDRSDGHRLQGCYKKREQWIGCLRTNLSRAHKLNT